MQENIKSYESIYQLRQAFIRSGGHADVFADDFNRLETPANFYFRIFFHFNTGHGLLNTGSQFIDTRANVFDYPTGSTNTAINYLYINGEHQRKQMLDDFVRLLSNINTYSPWYFQAVEGLQEALQRPEFTGEFKVEEEPKSIILKCLEDSYDNRISTLLDLYKSVAFSKIQHKEILPANLRRFDMSIYIINTPLAYVHYGYGDVDREKERNGLETNPRSLADGDPYPVSFDIPSFREWNKGSDKIFSSAKLIELQGCEIDANSAASAYGEVKSDEPFQMKHDIKITFKNLVEQRFNDTLNRIIGDLIFMDMDRSDRESRDNAWKYYDETETFSEAEIEDAEAQANDFIWEIDENGDLQQTIIGVPDLAQQMRDQNAFIDSSNISKREGSGPEGNIRTADSAQDRVELARQDAYINKASQSGIGESLSDYQKNPTETEIGNPLDKYKPSKLAEDFLKGAAGAAQNYIKSAINKVVMGNLYWGSITTPEANFNMQKFGANLTQRGLDKTVGKSIEYAKGSIRSSLNNLKTGIRGWTHQTSVGGNLADNKPQEQHRS